MAAANGPPATRARQARNRGWWQPGQLRRGGGPQFNLRPPRICEEGGSRSTREGEVEDEGRRKHWRSILTAQEARIATFELKSEHLPYPTLHARCKNHRANFLDLFPPAPAALE